MCALAPLSASHQGSTLPLELAVHDGLAKLATGNPELARLLRDGPFHEALRCALTASGLGLERVRSRLLRYGVDVSVSTLSCWQSGRRRPERPQSLVALARLEMIVGLPRGSLMALLGPPRPRGRKVASARPPAFGELWPDHVPLRRLYQSVDTRWEDAVTRHSQHDRVEVDAERRVRSIWRRQLLRADVDGPDRYVFVYRVDTPGAPLPELVAQQHCRVGRVATDPHAGILVAELLFDRVLARGETIITEHTVVHRSPRPADTTHECKLRYPVREYALEIRFDPAQLPSACYQYTSTCNDEPSTGQRLTLDGSGSVHAVSLRTRPCRFGISWTWD